MQPQPSATSPISTENSPTQQTPQHRQHGPVHPHEQPIAPADNAGAGPSLGSEEQIALDAALAASLQEKQPASRRLSPQGTPSPPALNRITQYEKASAPPVKRRDGPAFEVIKKSRSPNDKSSPIQDLPNEVLTHALAHLSPNDLTSVSLVSKRFHELVTGPHAWRSAFAHYFPGSQSLDASSAVDDDDQDVIRSERRAFTRLTPVASWRGEYIMRTRLLRSLARGKPVQPHITPSSSRSGQSHTASATVMYKAQLLTTINHLHATFGSGLNKKLPRFIHGADDMGSATTSDPNNAKVDSWGTTDLHFFLQFNERFPGDAQHGLGPGEVVGVPNVMDVSQPYGMVHGEGSPGGSIYYRSTEEMRGRFITTATIMPNLELGIPRIASSKEAITAVWIAKSSTIPSLTEGLIGILSGTSLGVLTAYSLGSTGNSNNRDQRFGRGEITARWALCPGVPIIAIAIDPEYSLSRHAQNRIWAVVLNALGEIFYLTKFPKRQHIDRGTKLDDEALERLAWQTGRTVYFNIVEVSRRVARPDPYAKAGVDGSYSPRSSWNGMCLSKDQIIAETREIEEYAARKPKDVRKACLGWDMQRRLEVDFAGDDGNNAGESVVVIDCGLDEENVASVKRFSRHKYHDRPSVGSLSTPPLAAANTKSSNSPSLFGGTSTGTAAPVPALSLDRLEDSLSQEDFTGSITPKAMSEEWRSSTLSLGRPKNTEILATAIDSSIYATQTISEDSSLNQHGRSTNSSPALMPVFTAEPIVDPADMPGQRARLFAVGTKTGTVILWNLRASPPKSAATSSIIEAVRLIHTSSPQISCLALSSLYLVHGGNDGLVQAWDPLGSDLQPIRTLHSRFSSRARRQLAQAQASPQGVGINLFAAGAICLDPDPTVLRGMVSLGIQLLYWSYSSAAADQYKSHKRRLRRSGRGSNSAGERFSGVTRSNLKDYIANERHELDREKEQKKKDSQRFAGRFGTELLDGSEEEMLAYAAMLSQETLEQEERIRRASDTSTATSTAVSTDHSAIATENITPAGSPSPRLSTPKTDEELDADVAEAIRLSLLATPSPNLGAYDFQIRHAKPKGRKGSSARPSPAVSPMLAGSSKGNELRDLDFALQLSLAEEQSKAEEGDGFPALVGKGAGKGKGRMG